MQLTKGEWEVTSLDAVDEAKGLVYFTATEKSPLERHLYRVALDGTGCERLTKDAGTHAAVFAPNAAAFYDTSSNAAAPPRQDLYRADSSRIATINENKIAELSDYHLSAMEFITVKSRDGVQLNASIITSRPEVDGTCPVTTLPVKYPMSDAMTMTVPPMVGVPRLVAWPAGPSSLIAWP